LVEKVKNIDTRLVDIELHGAPVAREHMRVDDARDTALETRVTHLEELRTAVAEIRGQNMVTNEKLDEFKKSLERMEADLRLLKPMK
jgi:hypothetical protein